MECRTSSTLTVLAVGLLPAPRLFEVVLQANGVVMPSELRSGLSIASAALLVAALTLGNAVIARAVLRCRHRGLAWSWLATLAFQSALLVPSFVAALAGGNVGSVLETPALRWIWSFGLGVTLLGVPAFAVIAEQIAGEPPCRCPHCGWRGDSPPALAGHLRACAARRSSSLVVAQDG
ncbi:MAG: hypothetical protein SF066_18575 [Thermoanaerobaculia bacterium]|nr:hypothetical protein [Thermoanaerobaculia bacterium]